MQEPLSQRRKVLASLLRQSGHVGISEASGRSLAEILKFTQSNGLDGIVAKRADSPYQSGLRTGVWCKHRFNRSQEFVIGGYVASHLGVHSIVVGVYGGQEPPLRSAGPSRIRSYHSPSGLRSNKHQRSSGCGMIRILAT
jgi:bifunctional non-homologous end joining protein LigD